MTIYGTNHPEPYDPGPIDNPTAQTVGQVHWEVGMPCQTEWYGEGVVLATGEEFIIVDFGGDIGVKRLLPRFTPLTTAEGTTYRPGLEDFATFDKKVMLQAAEMRAREAAKALLAYERRQADPEEPFDAGTLRELLARPEQPPMRVQGLIPADAATLIVAQRKTGKTTVNLNYAKAVLDGGTFLGTFDVRPLAGSVALLNYEVSGHTVAQWADEHGIDPDRFVVVNLRGRRNPLSHPDDRQVLAEYLRSHHVESLVVDPFGRAYDGKSQNDPGEVTAWLGALDQFARTDVGARDLLVTAHAGWNGERTRGASALEDWADVIITLTRDPDDETQRFIRAIGRDVELDEDRLDFDPHTRTLTLAGVGSRKHAKETRKVAELAVLVVRAAREQPGLSYTAAESHIRGMDDNPGFRSGDVAKAARYASQQGLLHIGTGLRGAASLTAVGPTSPTSPNRSPETLHTSPTSPNRGEVEMGELLDISSPRRPRRSRRTRR